MTLLLLDPVARAIALQALKKLEVHGVKTLSFWELAAINDFSDLATDETLLAQVEMFDNLEAMAVAS